MKGERAPRSDPLERRTDFDTAVKVELARIYCRVFGPAATSRYLTWSDLSAPSIARIFLRHYRRGRVGLY